MHLVRALWLLTCDLAYRNGVNSAGRALVRALGATEESTHMFAGMLLTRSGPRALPLLRNGLSRRENMPRVLDVMASIGVDPGELRPFVDDADPAVREAARQAVGYLTKKR